MDTKSILLEKGIVKDPEGKTVNYLNEILPDLDEQIEGGPSNFINEIHGRYKNKYPKADNSINGKIFEYLLACVLLREKLFPFYVEAMASFVPNVVFDIVFYTKTADHDHPVPVVLSQKTSFRERYKQADVEAAFLKNVHRKSRYYLITLSEKDAADVNKKVELGDIVGVDEAILATSKRFDDLIAQIKELDRRESEDFPLITADNAVMG